MVLVCLGMTGRRALVTERKRTERTGIGAKGEIGIRRGTVSVRDGTGIVIAGSEIMTVMQVRNLFFNHVFGYMCIWHYQSFTKEFINKNCFFNHSSETK